MSNECTMNVATIQHRLESLERMLDRPVLRAVWPADDKTLTLEAALEAAGEKAKAQAAALRQAASTGRAHFNMLTRPIVAVLGELNSGKSSVVASFLSPEGQRRVPRGDEGDKGTHRFVYWLPSKWMTDETIKNSCLELLSAVHGNQLQYLSHDPDKAATEYRSGRDNPDLFNLPLVADDPKLDELDAALLDCPDVQTRDKHLEHSSFGNDSLRLNFVADAARLCSAFLLIWERSKLRDSLLKSYLSAVRGRVASAPLYLLINKIEPRAGEPAGTLRENDLTTLVDEFTIKKCYTAFHFRMQSYEGNPGWEQLTPPKLVEIHARQEHPFPMFFVPHANGEDDQQSVDEDSFLAALPSQLDMGDLQRKKLDDNWRELASLVQGSLASTREWVESRRIQARRFHEGLLKFCTRQFTDSDTREPMQIPSPEFARAFRESLVRAVPFGVRWLLQLSDPVEKSIGWATKTAMKLGGPLKLLSDILDEELKKRGGRGATIGDAASFSLEMKSQPWVPEAIEMESLEDAWDAVLRNHQSATGIKFSPDQMDEMARTLWKCSSRRGKATLVIKHGSMAFGALAILAGTVTAAVDGGLTIYFAYSLIPGIWAVTGAGAGLVGVAAAKLMKDLLDLNTLPYLARFFALSCDTFGIPRRVGKGPVYVIFKSKKYQLPDPEVPEQRVVCPLDDIRLWMETPAFEEVQKVVKHD